MTELDQLCAALPAYEFEDVLGRGAWGIVVAAHHRRLNRPVAVKMLPPALTQDDNVRRRFATEAQLLATLDHPHIVQIHDYIEQDDVCALVMERLIGGTLAERMQLGRLRPEIASAIELATLHGLEHAHQHGVLHRDIKPENLMFAADGVLKITDFGIATVLGEQAERLTGIGVAMGTPAYMAPEQVDDTSAVGAAADIWAAGAVYYEMLSGTVPYPRKSTQAALLARTREDPKPIEDVAPDIPRAIGRTVMRALARDPERRYATSADFADALQAAGAKAWGDDWLTTTRNPVFKAARRPAVGTGATTGASVPAADPRTRERNRRHRRRTNIFVAASTAAVVAAGVTVGVLAFGSSKDGAKGASAAGASVSAGWASWIRSDKVIPEAPVDTPGVGPVPAGWGNRVTVGVALDDPKLRYVGDHFGHGIASAITFYGDPIDGPSWDYRAKSSHPAVDRVRAMEADGVQPYLTYYVLRVIGRGAGNDAAEQDLLNQLTNATRMRAYWLDVTELLKELGSLHQAIPLDVEPGVSSTVEAQLGDATKADAVIASSGLKDLAGLPNTFAGWAQAWVRLAHKYAPKVMLGLSLETWGIGNSHDSHNLVPFSRRNTDADVDTWAQDYAAYYRTLGTKFDFLDFVVAYGEAGQMTTKNADLYAHPADFARLVRFVKGVSVGAHTRVLLDQVPIGNTIMATENNTKFHWQDVYAQTLLGDNNYGYLLELRNAGVIGVMFGFGGVGPDLTCPCDAANDGRTQGVGPDQAPKGQIADSSDDDGGYLQQVVASYLDRGGMLLN